MTSIHFLKNLFDFDKLQQSYKLLNFKRLYATLQQQKHSILDIFDELDSQLPFNDAGG